MKRPLTVTHPDLIPEWDFARNEISPESVCKGSARKVFWKCARGHSFESAVFSRAAGAGCPYCAGKRAIPGETDLETTHPDIAREWDPDHNTLTPRDVSAGSHKMVFWRCEKGHHWQAAPYTRVAGAGCPYCTNRKVLPGFNDLATTHPDIAGEWYAPLNGSLTPFDITYGSSKRIWWRCREGHIWKAQVFSRTRERSASCPICASGKMHQPGALPSGIPQLQKPKPLT